MGASAVVAPKGDCGLDAKGPAAAAKGDGAAACAAACAAAFANGLVMPLLYQPAVTARTGVSEHFRPMLNH